MTTLNHLRLPQIDLTSVLAEPNPHIDLRIQAYENSARNFLNAISSYKNRAIATIADRRAAQVAERKRLLERIQSVEAETNQCKVREIELVADLEREKEERKDGELSVAAFRRQLSVLREKATSIDAEIEHYRAIVGNLRRERDTERSTLATHAAQVSVELEACQKHAALFIEGMEGDQLLFRFTHVQQTDPAREFSFVLQVTETGYRVKTSSPALPAMPLLVEALNSSRDVHKFIKSMRAAYQELAAIGG
ncbi:chromosome segregation protein Spc25-domain-containing protein [Infundibulicybe gibba]|nr:chromosome segregation protein Spc25-domain-containing protein [Infundibulicybe gibba]